MSVFKKLNTKLPYNPATLGKIGKRIKDRHLEKYLYIELHSSIIQTAKRKPIVHVHQQMDLKCCDFVQTLAQEGDPDTGYSGINLAMLWTVK